MLIGGILLGLVLGLLAGGRLRNLAEIQLRWTGLLVAALVLRFATEAALNAGIDIVETLRLPLLVAAFGVLLIPLWANRTYPGLILAFLGVLSNGLVILVNGGYMPIWEPALTYAGLTPADVTRSFHVIVEANAQDFVGRLLILGDVIPMPIPFIQNVYSLGDLFLGLGLAFFLFAGVVRVPTPIEEQQDADLRRRLAADRAGHRASGLAPGLERPYARKGRAESSPDRFGAELELALQRLGARQRITDGGCEDGVLRTTRERLLGATLRRDLDAVDEDAGHPPAAVAQGLVHEVEDPLLARRGPNGHADGGVQLARRIHLVEQ